MSQVALQQHRSTSITAATPNTARKNTLTHFIGGLSLYVIDLMLTTIPPSRTSSSGLLFNQATIYAMHSQMKQNQQIILFSPFQRWRGKKTQTQWKHYKKPLETTDFVIKFFIHWTRTLDNRTTTALPIWDFQCL